MAKKRSNRRKWIISGIIASLLICAAIPIILFCILSNSLSNLGEAFGNSCPSDEPHSVEGMARFRLPSSYDNFWSDCGGMQGWWAEAHFDMSPDDLDSLISNLWLDVELVEFSTGLEEITVKHIIFSQSADDPSNIQTGFYGYSESDADLVQEILIDTTNPELYRVYLVVLRG